MPLLRLYGQLLRECIKRHGIIGQAMGYLQVAVEPVRSIWFRSGLGEIGCPGQDMASRFPTHIPPKPDLNTPGLGASIC